VQAVVAVMATTLQAVLAAQVAAALATVVLDQQAQY
jgi:hypothetical protein